VRQANRRDSVEREIVSALRRLGCSVQRLQGDGVPDLLIGRAGLTWLAEVKTGDRPLRESQREWHAAWNGAPPVVLRTVDDALALLRPGGRP
jgi:hypothetical protein